MPNTHGRPHHCTGKYRPVGGVGQGGCDIDPHTHHCHTHEILCHIHPEIYYRNERGQQCYRCKQLAIVQAAQRLAAEARERAEKARRAQETKENIKLRSKPRHDKDGHGRDTGPGGRDEPITT